MLTFFEYFLNHEPVVMLALIELVINVLKFLP